MENRNFKHYTYIEKSIYSLFETVENIRVGEHITSCQSKIRQHGRKRDFLFLFINFCC